MARLTRRTFAIQSDVSEKIDALVDGHTLEANLLVDKALRRYLEWGRFVENFKLVTSDPRLMKLFWSHLTVDEAREMGIQNGTKRGRRIHPILFPQVRPRVSPEDLPGDRRGLLQRVRLLRVGRRTQP